MSPEEISSTYDGWIIVRRWAGTWIDLLVLGAAGALLYAATGANPVLTTLLWFILLTLYYPLLEGLTGQTAGKFLCSLKVVDAGGKTPGLWKGIVRSLFRLIEINPLLMGAIPAGVAVLTSRKRQRLGDVSANTFVLRTEDLEYLTAPAAGGPMGLGEFSIPGSPPPPSIPFPLPPPVVQQTRYGRPLPLPSRNRFWPLPGAALSTLFAVALIWHGVVANQQFEKIKPVSIPAARLLTTAPDTGWLQVTGCYLDLSHAVFETTEATSEYTAPPSSTEGKKAPVISSILVPVYAEPYEEGAKTPILLRTNDEKLVKLMQESLELDEDDTAKVEKWATANAAKLFARRDFTGTMKGQDSISTLVQTELADMKANQLTPKYVVLDASDQPVATAAIAEIGGGVIAAIIAFCFWLLLLIVPSSAPRSTLPNTWAPPPSY